MDIKHARDVLDQTHEGNKTSISISVVSQIHDIELKYLFEEDEGKPIKLIRQIVEDAVDQGDKGSKDETH